MIRKQFAFIYPLVVAGSFLVGRFACAAGDIDSIINPGDWVARLLGHIFNDIFVVFLGKLLLWIMDGVISVATYNGFLEAQAVQIGWPLVRDLANMFFVLGLLVIAIGTIIGIEEYKISHLLPRFVLMAVLINFSKGITGFLIDISQLIMLTFVNAFKDTTIANLSEGFGLTKLLTLNKQLTEGGQEAVNAGAVDILVAILLAGFMMFGATLVMLAMLVFLLLRTLAFWILIILSPLAFMFSVFSHSPVGEFAQKWWKELTRYLMVGPILAFFMWLAFAVISNYAGDKGNIASNEFRVMEGEELSEITSNDLGAEGKEFVGAISEAGTTTNVLNFFIVIGLLLVGLKEAAEQGTEGSKFAQGMYERLEHGVSMHGLREAVSERGEKTTGFGKEAVGGFLSRKGAEWTGKGGLKGIAGWAITAPKALPEAFKHYEEQRMRETMPQVVGKLQDTMNRIFIQRKTSYGEEAFIKAVNERQEEMSKGEPDAEQFATTWLQAMRSKSKVEKQAAMRKVIGSRFEDDMTESLVGELARNSEMQDKLNTLDPSGEKYKALRKGTLDLTEWQMFLREVYYGNMNKEEAEELAVNLTAFAEGEGKLRALGLAHVEQQADGSYKGVWSSKSEDGKVQAVNMTTGDAITEPDGKEVMVGHHIDFAEEITKAGKSKKEAEERGDAGAAKVQEKIIEHWRTQMGKMMAKEALKRMRRGSAEKWAESFEAAGFRFQTGSGDTEREQEYGKFGELTAYGRELLRIIPLSNISVIGKTRKTQARLVDIAGFTPYTEEQHDADVIRLEPQWISEGKTNDEIQGLKEELRSRVGSASAESVKPKMLLEVIMLKPELATQIVAKMNFNKDDKDKIIERIDDFAARVAPGMIADASRVDPKRARELERGVERMKVWSKTLKDIKETT